MKKRKREKSQLPLFPASGCHAAAQSERFALEPSPDEIRICSRCGKQIVVRRRSSKNEIVSEFVSGAGACFDCTHPRKR